MKNTKKKDEAVDKIKKETQNLLDQLMVKCQVEVTEQEGDEPLEKDTPSYNVHINTEETGLLIGRHGETLNSLQLILGIILYKKLGEWTRIVLDVADYRGKREKAVKEMAQRIAEEVETSGEEISLPQLTPLERRHVHLFLSNHKGVVTESTGEGKDRRLVVKPRRMERKAGRLLKQEMETPEAEHSEIEQS